MFRIIFCKLQLLCSKLRWSAFRQNKPVIVIRRFEQSVDSINGKVESVRDHGGQQQQESSRRIRVATFNAAMFSMAPAVSNASNVTVSNYADEDNKRGNARKGILKRAERSKDIEEQGESYEKRKMRVSINLPDNEISIERNERERESEKIGQQLQNRWSLPVERRKEAEVKRSVLEVLREVDADVIALQDVRAEEEDGMRPLSELAHNLGMKYVFGESWAPQYGNALLSKWPIKTSKILNFFDDSDYRNVLKATVDVADAGEVNFYCTQLDHLDESWRMKQINAILQQATDEGPYILAGGLNALDVTDYSQERWKHIVQYYEEIGKPTPKGEVMKLLKEKNYSDAKDFVGECQSVVIIAKGQDVQGTCKYGTRVDYILSSPDSTYKFVPGSYSVVSSKGTSDHHVVKVSFIVAKGGGDGNGRE